ncbi:hypothetical protein MGN70_010718 [Eutypa lata]|nr:hypothetical protein MGN70_010718 [Eutypa lata]
MSSSDKDERNLISFDIPDTAMSMIHNDSPGSTGPAAATAAAASLPCQHQPQQHQHHHHDASLDSNPQQGIIDFMREMCHILSKLPDLILDHRFIEAAQVEVRDLDDVDDGN